MARKPLALVVPLPAPAPTGEHAPPVSRRGQRAAARRELGAAAVLSAVQAVKLLPLAEAEARRWLHERGLVRDLAGRRVVIWGDVLDALRSSAAPDWPAPEPGSRASRAPGASLPRVRLRPL